MIARIPGMRVSARLGHSVWYEVAGEGREASAGTAMDWLNLMHIFGNVTVEPDEPYEYLHGGFYFTWAGATQRDLSNGALVVALLQHDGQNFLVPLDELLSVGPATTEWDQAVMAAAWQFARQVQLYEVVKPLTIDGADGDANGQP